jgi:hypothetical protein
VRLRGCAAIATATTALGTIRACPACETRGPASLPPVHLNFWDADSIRAFLELNDYSVERLIVQRSMLSVADPRRAPLRFLRLQAGALLRRYEGLQLFVAATPA